MVLVCFGSEASVVYLASVVVVSYCYCCCTVCLGLVSVGVRLGLFRGGVLCVLHYIHVLLTTTTITHCNRS